MIGTQQPGPNPYVGPRAFQRGETLYGRDHEVLELLDLLIAERIVLLYSPSGAGKTSLIQAALVPELEQEGFHVLPPMRVSLEPPQLAGRATNRYVLSLLLSLEETLAPDDQTSLNELATLTLGDYLDRRHAATSEPESLVLIFDQFEEILTVDPAGQPAKAAFFEQVGQALRDRQRWALFAMREEFLAGLDPYLRALPTRLSTTYRLELLGPGAAREAIQEPPRGAGVAFADDAALELVDDLRRVRVQRPDSSTAEQLGRYVDPVQLQVVCRRLWDRLPYGATQIVARDLEAVGDVDTALAAYYAERVAAVAATTGVHERAIRDWVDGQLITEQGIRGQVLQGRGTSQGLANVAIWPLVDAHLVRAETRRGATWFELAHDDDLDAVERQFLAACREDRERREQEQRQARRIRWLAVGATLFAVVAIALAIFGLGQWRATLAAQNQADRERATAVLLAQQEATAKARAEASLHVAETAEAVAEAQRAQAEQQQRVAQARALAAQSQAVSLDAPQRSLLLAIEATKNTLQTGDPRVAAGEQALLDALGRVGGLTLAVHDEGITSVAFSPDGRWLATGSYDDTVRLWDLWTEDPAAEPRVLHGGWVVTSVAFSPDGRWLAAGSWSRVTRLWDLKADDPDAEPQVLGNGDADVTSVAFSPDSRWLATGSDDDTVRLWDLGAEDPAAHSRVLRGDWTVSSVAFSPDGRWLATGDPGGAWLWDLGADDPGAEPLELRGHEGVVTSVAFSPDGRWLATGSWDATARLWDLEADDPAAESRVMYGHEGWVTSVAFSPDGRWLATGSDDATARLWNLWARDPNAGPLVLRGHDGEVTSVAFSPDGRWLATGSDDATARLWAPWTEDPAAEPLVLDGQGTVESVAFSPDSRWLAISGGQGSALLQDLKADDPHAEPRVLRGHEDNVISVAFSPDGRWLATGSWDTTARLWDLEADDPAAEPLVLSGHKHWVESVAFSPDGRWLATGSEDRTVRLWDLEADDPGAGPLVLRGHESSVRSVAFSPDGHWLATGSWDSTALLWDLEADDPAVEPLVLGHESWVTSVAFSPDGRWLATGSEDRNARLWDLEAADPGAGPLVLRGHEASVESVAFSADGRWLAIGGDDAIALLWDLHAGDPAADPLVLRGHADKILSVAFSPDGRWLATGSTDLTARLWDRDVDQLVVLACRDAGRNMTNEEWVRYMGAEPYRATCPAIPSGGGARRVLLDQVQSSAAAEDPLPSNNLCWLGSLNGFAGTVLPACEHAVELAPESDRPFYRDSRGLARAMTGDVAGALEDFRAFVEFCQADEACYARYGAKREAWIADLEAGRDPFDEETLEALRDE